MIGRFARRRAPASLAAAGFAVQAFGVALFGHGQWRVDVDLEELSRLQVRARQLPLGLERRDEGGNHDQARIHHQLTHAGHPAHVLGPVDGREAQVAAEAVAHVVAVEQGGVAAHSVQPLFQRVGDGGFARARQAGEPHHAGLLAFAQAAGGLVDGEGLPMELGGGTVGRNATQVAKL